MASIRPSNILFSCQFPHSEFSLRFNSNAVSTRFLTVESELRKVRGGQPLNRDAADALRCACIQGGIITLTRQHRLFKDGTGYCITDVLKIIVDGSEQDSYGTPGARPHRHRRSSRSASIEASEATASLHDVTGLDPAAKELAKAVCGERSECYCSDHTGQW